ncbi:MAG: tetratricopeptide repeat protein [Gallionellaceae bacterium]
MRSKKQGRFDAAAASYSRALSLKPDNAEAHNNLGIVRNSRGRLDAATASFQKAISLNPDYADAHFNLHTMLLDTDDMPPQLSA